MGGYFLPNNQNLQYFFLSKKKWWFDLFLIKLGFISLRYKNVKIPKNKKTIKLNTKNFFNIELLLKKLNFTN